MSKLTGQGLADFAKSKIGTPYVYGTKGADGKLTQAKLTRLAKLYPDVFNDDYIAKAKKHVGKVCTDCSGLISWYTGKALGSYQLYSRATKRGLIANIDKAPVGAVLWKPGHVGAYIGKDDVVEARSIDYGTVQCDVGERPFNYWLLFEDVMDYDGTTAETTFKGVNPFTEPTTTMKKGSSGEGVKWVQWELCEAGIEITIDGNYDSRTVKAIQTYQQSCKITVDGRVGATTRKCFKND